MGLLWLRRQSGLSTNQKVGGWIPGSSSLHVQVCLDKILNLKVFLKVVPSVCEWMIGLPLMSRHLAWQLLPSVYECVCDWVNVACSVKALWVVRRLERHYINAAHLPFTIAGSYSKHFLQNVLAKIHCCSNLLYLLMVCLGRAGTKV